ncbi:MAG: Asp-tRNA(Asn)/Glu-tRNA(Gln) amidotransferase subunit GatC [Candidatus Doudnabacteria bacterium]|nr:Asp-tRNA(Asn)/Glu-tRNA(Gln) amidotransferase subunit GatC [Candidatus Doudnabacteria bacterium]
MPDIPLEEVERIAKLARLRFEISEKPKLQKELSDILAYVDQLKEVESKIIEAEPDDKALNLVREDVSINSDDPEEFLKQAPSREGKFIKVKSILE